MVRLQELGRAARSGTIPGGSIDKDILRRFARRSVENLAALMHHKIRELLVAQRTQLLNALRSHLAEIGIIAAQGPNNARALAVLIVEGNDMIPAIVRRRCCLWCVG